MDTYEKKYKEALERAREYWETDNDNTLDIKAKGTMEYLFPELKESEDEKVRKEIITFISTTPKQRNRHPKWLAWLEKQGECHISHDDEIMIEQLTEYFTTGRGLQNTNETVVAWLNDVKEKLEKQGKVESDNDDIEAKEKGIRKAFNKIEDEKQDKQKSQRMISAEAKEAMYDKPADTVEQKCEESKTKIFDAPTPFEDKLYVFVAACEFLAIPSKIEFILEHSQEILDAAREQIGKEQSSAWSEEDEERFQSCIKILQTSDGYDTINTKWFKSLKDRVQPQATWKPSNEQMATLYKYAEQNNYDGSILTSLYNDLKKLREE